MLKDKPVSILIYPGASLSYVSPRIVELYKLHQDKFEMSLLVQLATGTKWKVTIFLKKCDFIINGLKRHVDLNILPIGSSDLLIWMDWLEKHRFILNCYDKTFSCMNDKGNTIVVKGIPRKVTIGEISALQMKRYAHKWYNFFVVYLMDDKEKDNKLNIEDIPILKYFKDIFQEAILELPSKRDIYFTIDLVPREILTSKDRYRMNIVKMTELNSQIQ